MLIIQSFRNLFLAMIAVVAPLSAPGSHCTWKMWGVGLAARELKLNSKQLALPRWKRGDKRMSGAGSSSGFYGLSTRATSRGQPNITATPRNLSNPIQYGPGMQLADHPEAIDGVMTFDSDNDEQSDHISNIALHDTARIP